MNLFRSLVVVPLILSPIDISTAWITTYPERRVVNRQKTNQMYRHDTNPYFFQQVRWRNHGKYWCSSSKSITLYMSVENDMSRRDIFRKLCQVASLSFLTVATTSSKPSIASATTASKKPVKISSWPKVEYLEPVYEFQVSVLEPIQQKISNPAQYSVIQKRLELFFSKGLFSERNYYAGLGVQYMNQIQYDPSEPDEYVRLDKEERFNSMEDTMKYLKNLMGLLQKQELVRQRLEFQKKQGSPTDAGSTTTTSADDDKILQNVALAAKGSLDHWFSLVPSEDLDGAKNLFDKAKKADANYNGMLEDDELSSLSIDDQITWKRRVELVGGDKMF